MEIGVDQFLPGVLLQMGGKDRHIQRRSQQSGGEFSPGCHCGSSSGTQKHSACQFDVGVLYRLHRKVGDRESRSADRLTLVTW